MENSAAIHDALSGLFTYPRDGFVSGLRECVGLVAEASPTAASKLGPFLVWAESNSISDLEEFYTRTFDYTADTALECGWHVHGESYDRGAFLVEMRQELRKAGVEENGELPDHLSHVLAVIGRSEVARASDLAHNTATPSLKKILAALPGEDHPYRAVVEATLAVLALHRVPETTGC